jgi:hypothetical protein
MGETPMPPQNRLPVCVRTRIRGMRDDNEKFLIPFHEPGFVLDSFSRGTHTHPVKR